MPNGENADSPSHGVPVNETGGEEREEEEEEEHEEEDQLAFPP